MIKFRPLAFASVVFFAAMLGSWCAFKSIGSQLEGDGTLREPFALVPIGFLAGAAGLICLGAAGANLRHDYGRRKKSPD